MCGTGGLDVGWVGRVGWVDWSMDESGLGRFCSVSQENQHLSKDYAFCNGPSPAMGTRQSSHKHVLSVKQVFM